MTVTVGRNVGSDPMTVDDWLDFQDSVEHAFYQAGVPVYFAGTGKGWSPQWGAEEAFTIIGEAPEDDGERDDLMAHLGLLCGLYGQEAVAVTVGEVRFVEHEEV